MLLSFVGFSFSQSGHALKATGAQVFDHCRMRSASVLGEALVRLSGKSLTYISCCGQVSVNVGMRASERLLHGVPNHTDAMIFSSMSWREAISC